MNKHIKIPTLLLLASSCLFADSILSGVDLPSDDASGLNSNPGTPYEGYFSFESTGDTTLLDDFGSAPGTFLFTPNTFFAFKGTPIVDIIQVTDPNTSGAGSTGPSITQQGVPEPRSVFLTLGSLMLGFALYRRRANPS